MMMHDIYGLDVLKIIKNNAKYKNIPIIIQSGIADSGEIDKAFEMGAVDYVRKPYQSDILIKSIKRALGV